jgi:hypothetical protein
MKVMIDVFEMYTRFNEERGDWSNISEQTEGMINVKNGAVMSLEDLNKAIESVGHTPLSEEAFTVGIWAAQEEDIGRFDYSFVGTSDGTPDKNGKFLYDISLWLHRIETSPLTQTELLRGLS